MIIASQQIATRHHTARNLILDITLRPYLLPAGLSSIEWLTLASIPCIMTAL
jgi:hypothetical protein